MKHRKWLTPFPMLRLCMSLLLLWQGFPADAFSVQGNVGIRVYSPVSVPTAITAIQARADFSTPERAGGVRLQWSAPQTPDGDRVFSYVVRYATYPVAAAGSVAGWWNHPATLTALDHVVPAEWGRKAYTAPRSSETVVVTGLSPGTYYYFGVRSRDRYFRLSDYDEGAGGLLAQSNAYAAPEPWNPARITDLAATIPPEIGTVNLSWTVPQLVNEQSQLVSGKYIEGEYCVQYSSESPPGTLNRPNQSNNWQLSNRVFISTGNVTTGVVQAVRLTGLQVNTTYYFYVFTRNEWPGHWSEQNLGYVSVKTYSIKPVENIMVVAKDSADPSVGSFVTLQWDNPSDEPALSGTRICYATLGYPASPESPDSIDLPGQLQGQTTSYNHFRLLPRTTYYYALYTYDDDGVFSAGVQISVVTNPDILAPEPVRNLTAVARVDISQPEDRYIMTLNWTNPPAAPLHRNSDFRGTKIYYSTFTAEMSQQQYLASIEGATDQSASFVHDNLSLYATYYYSMVTYDIANNVSTGPVVTFLHISSDYMPPAKPSVISSLASAVPDPAVGFSVYLEWAAPSDPPGLLGIQIRSRDDRFPENTNDGILWLDWRGSTGTVASYRFDNLVPETSYYISLFAISKTGVVSRKNDVLTYTKVPWSDNVSPFEPLGIRMVKKPGNEVYLEWKPVEFNNNYTRFSSRMAPMLSELYSYEVYRSTDAFAGEWTRTAPLMGQTTASTLALPDDKIHYFKIRAKDVSGNYSDSYVVSSLNETFVASAEKSYLYLPAGVREMLSRENNGLSGDLVLRISRREEEELGPIVKSLEWNAYQVLGSTSGFTLEPVERFNLATVKGNEVSASELSLSMLVEGSRGTVLAPALRAVPASQLDRWLSAYYFNGVEWLKLNSAVDQLRQEMRVKARFAGRYQMRAVPPAAEFTFYGIMPKIITPNNDGQNDLVFFRFANPRSLLVTVHVFDSNGDLVRKLSESTATSDIHGQYVSWDGSDRDGRIVAPGVYLYQIECDGKVLNGTIVVAR